MWNRQNAWGDYERDRCVCRGQRSEERLIFALRGAIRGRLATIAVLDRLNYRRWDTNTRFNKRMGTVLSGDGRERELAAARPRRCCSRGLGEKNPVSLGYASSFYSRTRPVNSTSDWAGTTKPVQPPSTHRGHDKKGLGGHASSKERSSAAERSVGKASGQELRSLPLLAAGLWTASSSFTCNNGHAARRAR